MNIDARVMNEMFEKLCTDDQYKKFDRVDDRKKRQFRQELVKSAEKLYTIEKEIEQEVDNLI